ncbi:unnamed protein product [Camellia sinensis]
MPATPKDLVGCAGFWNLDSLVQHWVRRDCLEAYHVECVAKDESFVESGNSWTCKFACVRRNKGFCNHYLKFALLWEENMDVDSDGTTNPITTRRGKIRTSEGKGVVMKREVKSKGKGVVMKRVVKSKGKGVVMKREAKSKGKGVVMKRVVKSKGKGAVMKREVKSKGKGGVMKRAVKSKGKGVVMKREVKSKGKGVVMKREAKSKGKGVVMKRVVKSKGKGAVMKREVKSKGKGVVMKRAVKSKGKGVLMKRAVKSKGKGVVMKREGVTLMEFLASLGEDTSTKMSQYDVSSIIKEYINEPKLFCPDNRRKILCNERLKSNPESSDEDELGLSSEAEDENVMVACKKQRELITNRKSPEKEVVINASQSCFASIVSENIKLVYLKRSLVQELLKQPETFENKLIGSFVRVKLDPNDSFQRNSDQLVQVIGIKKISKGDNNTQILLQVSNMSKDICISMLSDVFFSEEECEDLSPKVKDGLLKKPTIVDIELKARSLHEDITKHNIAKKKRSLASIIEELDRSEPKITRNQEASAVQLTGWSSSDDNDGSRVAIRKQKLNGVDTPVWRYQWLNEERNGKSHGNSEFTDLPYSERALILSVYADGLSSHVTWCTGIFLKPFITNYITTKGGKNLQRGDSSRRGGGRGSNDAEDETPFALLDASCACHDRFGKRHFVMPKYYRDPCGLVEDPSDNQTGYGLANVRLLKWPALFIERVQMERLCRENRLKVSKARSVEIQKEDPDNVDRLCERLQREISQMGRRFARDMQLHIVKKDAQKNRTEPNVAAIKGIMEDPELVSDAELSDCSDSEPPVDLSAN